MATNQKVAVITGASQGIGAALVKAYRDRNFFVVANSRSIKPSTDEGVLVVPGDIGTWGGVVSDEYARVLRPDGSPIPGLYATGVTTAGVAGRYYVGPGSSIGPSFVWGWVAARNCR